MTLHPLVHGSAARGPYRCIQVQVGVEGERNAGDVYAIRPGVPHGAANSPRHPSCPLKDPKFPERPSRPRRGSICAGRDQPFELAKSEDSVSMKAGERTG